MFKHPVFLSLTAMLCGAPATIVAAVMLPWSIAIAVAGLMEQPKLAILNLLLVVAAPYALGSYYLLAARTIRGQSFKRSWAFRAACIAALLSTVAVFDTLSLVAALAVAGPIIAATVFCLRRQRAMEVYRNAA